MSEPLTWKRLHSKVGRSGRHLNMLFEKLIERAVRRNRIAIAYLGCVLGLTACSLPDGKVSSGVKRDAQVEAGANDAGSQLRDASSGSRVVQGGAGGTPGKAAPDGGVALDAGADEPTKKIIGDRCSSNAECRTMNCRKGADESRRCHGTVERGGFCIGVHDCAADSCVPSKHGEPTGVCIDTRACAADKCVMDQAIAVCQLEQLCSETGNDFARCVSEKCAVDADADAGCAESPEQRLNELGCCRPADVGTCGIAPQCGCNADEKCDFVNDMSGKTACGPVEPAAADGLCAGDSQCGKGTVCLGKICKSYCAGPTDKSCPAGTACAARVIDGRPTPGVFLCKRRCDPTSPSTQDEEFNGCSSGQRCDPLEDGNSDCMANAGTGTRGAPCADDTGRGDNSYCAPGFVCVSPGACFPYCKVEGGTCDVGTCHSFGNGKLYAGAIEIGYCD